MVDETRSAQVLIRMKPSVKEAAQRAAGDDSQSLSSLVEKLLVKHLTTKKYLASEGPHAGRTAQGASDARGMADRAIDRAFRQSSEPTRVKDRRRRALTEMPAGFEKRKPTGEGRS
jgi:hypothetical protein